MPVSDADAYLYQRGLAGLRVTVQRRMTAALRVVAERYPDDPVRFRDASIGVMQNLTREYGAVAGQFSADWYNAMRSQEGIRDRYVARGFIGDYDEQVAQTIRRAVGDLFTAAPDLEAVFASITDKASKYVADNGRETVRRNSFTDPRGQGWHRVAIGETCDFCLMLTGRGGVYTRSSVRFKSHVKCNCACAPSWDANAVEVPDIAYEASARTASLSPRQRDEMNKRIRDWIGGNSDELASLRESLTAP